jgi:hypothetical protein
MVALPDSAILPHGGGILPLRDFSEQIAVKTRV